LIIGVETSPVDAVQRTPDFLCGEVACPILWGSWILKVNRTFFLIPAMHSRLPSWTRRLSGWMVLFLVTSLRLRGEVLETITSLTITNFTGHVIASDAVFGGAGYHRDTIDVESVVNFSRSTATTNYVFDYTWSLSPKPLFFETHPGPRHVLNQAMKV
jgi:hypothetical protein